MIAYSRARSANVTRAAEVLHGACSRGGLPMHVREIMSADLVSCGPDTPLREVARLMAEHDCGPIPIVSAADRRQPMGVVTDRDIACRVVAKGRNPLDLTAKDCMSSPVVTIAQDAPVEDCCRLMEQHQVRRVLGDRRTQRRVRNRLTGRHRSRHAGKNGRPRRQGRFATNANRFALTLLIHDPVRLQPWLGSLLFYGLTGVTHASKHAIVNRFRSARS